MPSDQRRTARRRRLGTELRALRETSGLTPKDAAEALSCDVTKISRMELGRSGVRKLDLETLLKLYAVSDPAKRRALAVLSRESRKRTWWHQYTDILRPGAGDLLDMESEAERILDFESTLVPGLLQTESYTRALIAGGGVVSEPKAIEARVRLRMERKRVFDADAPPQYVAVIDESALHRRIGTPEVMAEQLQYLVEMSRPPHVSVHVVPAEAGAYPGLDGPFCVLSYPHDVGLDMVLLDHRFDGLWLEDADQVRRYKLLFEHLRALALSSPQTKALLQRLAHEHAQRAE
ncbi:helix-turn-helix domain-containing protein [Streptomyces sp. N2-109]|uniref:Helix-turn-helix domain-containing protein n=1 Tax=Streptomyces gossypii TaxID=2883101 RepID=A0ABT2K3T1_9ACTN|nr:helix-turn-helix transcriptional regulator [Streptomyces gossypii]MCT2594175.1 helix-turn-helix domain-containing protein [Streptomyces gossypii]